MFKSLAAQLTVVAALAIVTTPVAVTAQDLRVADDVADTTLDDLLPSLDPLKDVDPSIDPADQFEDEELVKI